MGPFMTIAWCCGFAVKYVAGTDVLVRLSIEERKAKKNERTTNPHHSPRVLALRLNRIDGAPEGE